MKLTTAIFMLALAMVALTTPVLATMCMDGQPPVIISAQLFASNGEERDIADFASDLQCAMNTGGGKFVIAVRDNVVTVERLDPQYYGEPILTLKIAKARFVYTKISYTVCGDPTPISSQSVGYGGFEIYK